MLNYSPVAWRPAVSSPTIRRQARYNLGQQFDSLFGWSPTTGDVIRLGFHTTTAVLGFRVWLTDKNKFFKYFALLLAVGQTVGAICDGISIFKRITGTHPPEMPRSA